LRMLTKMTGKSEGELRTEMNNELEEMEREVSAMKEILKAKAKGKKVSEVKKEPKEPKEPKAKAAPKKKAAAAVAAVAAAVTQ